MELVPFSSLAGQHQQMLQVYLPHLSLYNLAQGPLDGREKGQGVQMQKIVIYTFTE
jgi:hypothetical protein